MKVLKFMRDGGQGASEHKWQLLQYRQPRRQLHR
jgi:hypothetical protein